MVEKVLWLAYMVALVVLVIQLLIDDEVDDDIILLVVELLDDDEMRVGLLDVQYTEINDVMVELEFIMLDEDDDEQSQFEVPEFVILQLVVEGLDEVVNVVVFLENGNGILDDDDELDGALVDVDDVDEVEIERRRLLDVDALLHTMVDDEVVDLIERIVYEVDANEYLSSVILRLVDIT